MAVFREESPMPVRPNDTFHVAFDTASLPGHALVTTVQITRKVFTPVVAKRTRFRVDLCDHTLYPDLVAYVLAHPIPKQAT